MSTEQMLGLGEISKGAFNAVADRALLIEALAALLRERSAAYRLAAEIAGAKGLSVPAVEDYMLPDILRLNRWLQEKC